MVRLPKELVRRAEALWDRIVDDPAIRGVLPRSGTAAVRILLEREVERLSR